MDLSVLTSVELMSYDIVKDDPGEGDFIFKDVLSLRHTICLSQEKPTFLLVQM